MGEVSYKTKTRLDSREEIQPHLYFYLQGGNPSNCFLRLPEINLRQTSDNRDKSIFIP